MCGAISFKLNNISERELERFYNDADLGRLKRAGRADVYYWQDQPVLPIVTQQGIVLKPWGNKDKSLKLPVTGWARQESFNAGKWEWLNPVKVKIAIDRGAEKKLWFATPQGVDGVMIRQGQTEYVYMLTREASPEYLKNTNHQREPIGLIKF